MNTQTIAAYVPAKIPISQWAEEDQPQKKLLLKGKSALSDAELLSIIIGCGNDEDNQLDIARKMLAAVENNLTEFSRLSVHDLMKYKGIGQAKAVMIVSMFELGRRRKYADPVKRECIITSKDAFDIFGPLLGDLMHEEFWVLLLNRRDIVLSKQMISSGGMSGTVVDPKMVFITALNHKAAGLILCHNHPSGDVKPSQQDIDLTKKLVSAGKLMEINVLDHVICGSTKFYSFADEGVL